MLLLTAVRWKNFLSTGNYWNEVRLDKFPTTLVVGKNGEGKSTFLDAVSFSLYGKPFRNVTKNQLVNSINQKGALVEAEFQKEGHTYLVRRGIKPGVFEIVKDGELIPQDASVRDYQEILERDVLRMDHRSFCQVVTLGSASFVPFMQLPAGQRREFVEDLLDIRVFSAMAKGLKSRMDSNASLLKDLKKDRDMVQSGIDQMVDDLRRVLARITQARENASDAVLVLKEELRGIKETYDSSQAEERRLSATIEDHVQVRTRLQLLREKRTELAERERTILAETEVFRHAGQCPTCTREIDPEFAEKAISDRAAKVLSIRSATDHITQLIGTEEARLTEIASVTETINRHIQSWRIATVQAEDVARRIKELQKPLSVEEDQEILEKRLVEARVSLEKTEAKILEVSGDRKVMEAAALLLKDGGIKTHIVRQYVPLINRLANRYLDDMGFFVKFELDDQFNESIRSRFRDVFSYSSFSEGEKLRIDLALLFTWRDIAKIRNSASTNLLVMDEILDSSLDMQGVEELVKVMKHVTQGTNTFVISHRGDQLLDRFDDVIRFEKDGHFSRRIE